MLEVKRSLPAWTAKLRNDGWDVHRFSIAEAIADILEHTPQRKIWLAADRKAPLAWKKTNESLARTRWPKGRCRSGCARCLRACAASPTRSSW